jgi:hypothetical protein
MSLQARGPLYTNPSARAICAQGTGWCLPYAAQVCIEVPLKVPLQKFREYYWIVVATIEEIVKKVSMERRQAELLPWHEILGNKKKDIERKVDHKGIR